MSKNLKRASDWIQKQIDELKSEQTDLLDTANSARGRADELQLQIIELEEAKEKLGVENGKEEKEEQ